MENDTCVKVAVRIRPLLDWEMSQNCGSCVTTSLGDSQVIIGSDHCFTFDHVFGIESTQLEVYERSVQNLVEGTKSKNLSYLKNL